jgi:hypothetical protein
MPACFVEGDERRVDFFRAACAHDRKGGVAK